MDGSRVYYFSQNDMSIGSNLMILEERLEGFDPTSFVKDINDAVELFQIKQHIENGNFLTKWDDSYIARIKDLVRGFSKIIIDYFRSIPKENLWNEYQKMDWDYERTFWKIVSDFKLFDLIDEALLDLILSNNNKLRILLKHKSVVEKFGKYLYNSLLENPISAHILLDKYVTNDVYGNGYEIFLPKQLTIIDKEQIIINFLNQEEPNINYVRLVLQIKNDTDFSINTKTKLLAEDVEHKLNNKYKDKANFVSIEYGIMYDDTDIPSRIDDINNTKTCVYGKRFLKKLSDVEKIHVFGTLFELIDGDHILSLINKDVETHGLEFCISNIGKNAYFMNCYCKFRNGFAINNIELYSRVLTSFGNRLEFLVKNFYESYFNKFFGYPALAITLPPEELDWLSKCRIIMPELDAISKQYSLYVEEGEIDPRLYSMSSPKPTTDIKSLFHNKYYYLKNGAKSLLEPMILLYKRAEVLHTINGYDNSDVSNFYQFISKHKVPYDTYKDDYRKPKVDRLIELGYIKISEDGILQFDNKIGSEILGCLWRNKVISYWHQEKDTQNMLDKWKEDGLLDVDEHLLCESERNLFDYYLNNSKYTNGPAIRNDYAHGTIPFDTDPQIHKTNYFILLLLIIILILKIEDEFRIGCKILAEYGFPNTIHE